MNDTTSSREQSAIQFPYADLAEAVSFARGLLKGGGVPLSRDQLAAALEVAPSGGSFSIKLAACRMFGFMESSQGKYQLTPLGFEVLDADRERASMVKAFLNVPLYQRVYDEFRGKLLPPRPHGLEQAFVNFGVSAKQKDKARQIFDRSARLAGFFPNGQEDRLVEPIVLSAADTGKQTEQQIKPETADRQHVQAASPMPPMHSSIVGMLEELPPPKSEWSKRDQADWLQALAFMFRVIYRAGDQGEVIVSVNHGNPSGSSVV